jgi:DNA-directed RNA polymerase subunit alpha
MSDAPVDFSAFFNTDRFDAATLARFADATHANAGERERFDSELKRYAEAASGAEAALRLGIGCLLLSRFAEAAQWFKKAGGSAERHYYAAEALSAQDKFEDAAAEYGEAASKGWDRFECDMRIAALRVRAGDAKAADALLRKHEQAGSDRPEWYFVRGLLHELQIDRDGALDSYTRALTLNPEHLPAAFHAARLHDLRGEDGEAIELYQRLSGHPRAQVNALINLAVLLEDRGEIERASQGLRRVLDAFPNHARARLFLKDVESSRGMMIDDSGERSAERRSKLLETPISEFELSMRARNCLKKMNVQTLGDLLGLSETELLSFKNFGETSLNEIRALLTKKGLKLGQDPSQVDMTTLEQAAEEPPAPKVVVPPGSEAILTKPVSELELSVRARRCLQRLNVVTISDLIQHSETDLMAVRNFGQTSLNEIKLRLGDLGLSLAPKN